MKTSAVLVSVLVLLSSVSGWLLSKATLIGRTGINLFYKEYRFLKIWWQGGLVVFAGLMAWMFIHYLIQKKLQRTNAVILYAGLLLVAIAGLYFTYQDFRNDFSHRLLGERFHIGAYLFWIGCMIITCFYLLRIFVTHKEQNSLMESTARK